MASSTELHTPAMISNKKNFLDLPSETIALILENAIPHDLAQLCRVSKSVRELAAAELYRDLCHTFEEDHLSSKLGVDYLAGFLETLATSDYNYAGHVRQVYVDTVYAAVKGEQACRQFGYEYTCGKFLNTLLLAALKRTTCLEGFIWNARIELSTAVYLVLHRMPNLRTVQIRLQAGQSLHSMSKSNSGTNPSAASVNANPLSPGPPPPGPHSPGGYGYTQPAQPSNSIRMVQKLPVTRPASQPCSFSGFKHLKSLSALDMDTLEYIPEIASCVRNSLDTLKHFDLSLSDTLARRAREKPRLDGSDGGATSDDASSVASQPLMADDEGAPAGGNPEQWRQWHRARQEAILSRIFAPSSPNSNAKGMETAANEVVVRAESEVQSELDRDALDQSRDDEDREFVKMMHAIFRAARAKQDSSSNVGKAFENMEKVATKYLERRSKSVDETKPKPKSKSSVIKIKTPKPPPASSWQGPHPTSSSYKSYSVHEPVLLEYFGFPKTSWDQMTALMKNQYVQTYFKETQGVGYQTYPMPPPPPGKSTGLNKMYYANPNSVPGYIPSSKCIVIPPKKIKKTPPPKPKYTSDSDDLDKTLKLLNSAADAENTITPDLSSSPTTKNEKVGLSDDSDILFPSEEEDGADQQFESEDEGTGDEESPAKRETEGIKPEINGVVKESGLTEESDESTVVLGKGKQAVRDPPNGHLTPPKPAVSQEISVRSNATPATEEDAVSKYLRLSHGLPVERLAIYLVPVKPTILLQHFDPYSLKDVTLLNVGSQRRIWATLAKLQRQSALPISSIYTDNVTPALLTFIESLAPGQLEVLFLLERYLRRKGRVPQLQDCDKTSVDIDAIRRQILKKHLKGFKRLMIRNDDSESWAMNNATIRLIAREGVNLRELAVQCDTIFFHTLVRSIPSLPSLYALHINFILDNGTPPISMTGVAIFATHHYGGTNIEAHNSAPGTILHELRECVVDGMTFCKDGTQLEWLGFSWSSGRGTSHLDTEGNPHVFLTRVVREVDAEGSGEGETEDEEEDVVREGRGEGAGAGAGFGAGVEGGSSRELGKWQQQQQQQKQKQGKEDAKAQNITFWAENDLDISEVQGVRMWDKAVWAGRL